MTQTLFSRWRPLLGCVLIATFLMLPACRTGRVADGIQAPTWTPLPVEWVRPVDTPCLDLGDQGEFDSHHIFAPCVYPHESGYRMLYCGSGPQEGRLFKVGLADSPDGFHWTKSDAGPVLDFGDGKTSLVTPSLVRYGAGWPDVREGKLQMYVVAVDFNGDMAHRLYMTTSSDNGRSWSTLTGPIMENVYAPTVLHESDEYRMWYTDVSTEPWCIRMAVSGNGMDWTPADPEPVLVVDQSWEKDNLFYPCVIRDDDGQNASRYVMFYGSYWSARDDTTAIGLAVSDDGIHWSKYQDNPIIRPDESRPFESHYCTSHTVLARCIEHDMADVLFGRRTRVCDGYRIWYATRNAEPAAHKYFAIATAVTSWSSLEKETVVPQPEFSMSACRANDTRLEPLHFLDRFGKQTRASCSFTATTQQAWRTWHRRFRRELTEAIGLTRMATDGLPPTQARPMRVIPGPVDQCNGYKRLAFTIETAPGLYVPAFLLVPDGLDEPRPAILCSHGHSIGMNSLVALTEEGKPRQYKQGYQHDFAVQAVKAGFVSLAFEQMGFGRRRDIDFHKKYKMGNHCEQPSKNAIHWGLSMTGIRVWDAMRMIDFLQTRPEVDPERIGMVGISGGGLVTQFTAALDDRIGAACVSGFCNRFGDCILAIHHCIDNYVPGLGQLGDNDDVACLIAPRPLLIEAGIQDPIFPIAATRAAIRKIRTCYRFLESPGNLSTNLFDGPHEFEGSKTWNFFAKHLKKPH